MGGRRSSAWTKQKRALGLLIVVIVVLVSAFLELKETHYTNAVGLFMIVFGFLVWLVTTQVEGYCGALKKDRKGYCTKRIRGLLFGCHLHVWQRPLGLLHIGNRPIYPHAPPVAAGHSAAASAALPPPLPGEREHRRGAIVFWVSISSLIVGSLSTFTDLWGWVADIT